MFKKRAPKGAQKWSFILVVAPLGAPLEPQADFEFKKWAHSAPQSAPGTEKELKNEPTAPTKWPQGLKNTPKMVPKVLQNTRPGGLREAL